MDEDIKEKITPFEHSIAKSMGITPEEVHLAIEMGQSPEDIMAVKQTRWNQRSEQVSNLQLEMGAPRIRIGGS